MRVKRELGVRLRYRTVQEALARIESNGRAAQG
jgi:hypothetical protein